MPVISIVVPVYKAEKYLAQCVDSILAQTVTDLEVILVNDGSPDASPAICDALAQKDARVRVIHKENGGVSSARKAGIAAATAPFVGFVDADDYVSPTMYQVMLEAAAQHDADLVECGYYEVDNGSEERFASAESRVMTRREIASEMLIPLLNETGAWTCFLAWSCWNKIYNTARLANAMQMDDETIAIGEDMLQNVFYLAHCERAVILAGECHYYYRRNDTSVMHAKTMHLAEVAYMQRGIVCAPRLGYTGEGLRSLLAYTVVHDLIKAMFYTDMKTNEKLAMVRKLIACLGGEASFKTYFKTHSASQGIATKICLQVMRSNIASLQWLVLALLGLRK